MATSKTESEESPDYEHPIDQDIVETVAKKLSIPHELLHEVLEECENVWNPYRNHLREALYVYSRGSEFSAQFFQNDEHDVFVVGGAAARPTYVIQRINLNDLLHDSMEDVTTVEMGLAVKVAHEKQVDRFGYGTIDSPTVIQRP